MKTLTIRDFRTRPGAVRRELAAESQAVLTANGRPFALVVPVNGDTLDKTVRAIRNSRAQMALQAIRERACRTGKDRLGMGEIDAVIARSRVARRKMQRQTNRD